eukprot:4250960-Pyramimonas_sp.AAC.2
MRSGGVGGFGRVVVYVKTASASTSAAAMAVAVAKAIMACLQYCCVWRHMHTTYTSNKAVVSSARRTLILQGAIELDGAHAEAVPVQHGPLRFDGTLGGVRHAGLGAGGA